MLPVLLVLVGLAACGETKPTPDGLALDLVILGAGEVRVVVGGDATTCRDACQVPVEEGTEITLTAQPDPGITFVGWGVECSGYESCTFVMHEDRSVSARFARDVLIVTLAGDARVRADINPGYGGGPAAACETTCRVWYETPVLASVAVTLLEPDILTAPWQGCTATNGALYCLVDVDGATDVVFGAARPPKAIPDAYATLEDSPVIVDAPEGVLANDEDSPGAVLTAVLLSDPETGSLELNADGSFRYVPAPDENDLTSGPATFRYYAVDEHGGVSEPATVTIAVHPVNDAPTFEIPDDPPLVKDGSGAQEVPSFAIGIGPGGGADEVDQALAFEVEHVSSEGSLAFDVVPTLHADGTLWYTPRPRTFGTASFEAVLGDDGGTENGGVDRSEPRTFVVKVRGLVLTVIVRGPGTFALDPPGGEYAYDTKVTVRAIPDRGAEIDDWGGACWYVKSKSDTCSVRMTNDATVRLDFDDD
ncbi:MAG: Ig-like domain-containing protein [Trueperaceae bacterium]